MKRHCSAHVTIQDEPRDSYYDASSDSCSDDPTSCMMTRDKGKGTGKPYVPTRPTPLANEEPVPNEWTFPTGTVRQMEEQRGLAKAHFEASLF